MRTASIVSAALALALLRVPSLHAQSEKWERPDVKVGDSWTYQTKDLWTKIVRPPYTLTVEAVGPLTINVESTVQDGRHFKWVYTRDWNLAARPGPRFVEPYWPSYSWPLEVGKKWGGDATWPGPPSMAGTWKASFNSRVVGVEKVTVAAGTFDTVKIERKGRYSTNAHSGSWNGWGGEIIETHWYAPAVRRAVKFTYTDTSGARILTKDETELVKYKLSE
jgi:hypothetical protein